MNSFLAVGGLVVVLAFCGLGDRLKQLSGGAGSANTSSSSNSDSTSSTGNVEKPTLTAAQRSIQDSSTEASWDAQGISFKVPSGFSKMDVKKESFNYGSPATGFLIASISVMSDSFPSDVSIQATYDAALEQLKQGKYARVRWLEIDGVKGVEWVEAPPEEKDGIRRHQWIAFRKYQGQNQQLNIILSTDQTKFDKQEDAFSAILYSLKAAKG